MAPAMTPLNFSPRRRASMVRRRVWVFAHESGRQISVPVGLGEILFILVQGESIAKTGGRARKMTELAELGIPTIAGEFVGSIRLPEGHGWSFVTIRDAEPGPC